MITTTATATTSCSAGRRATDFAAVTAAWAVVVAAAAVFPVEDPPVSRLALFIHLMSMTIGFGAVVMIDAYGILCLFGRRTLSEVVDVGKAAHGLIAAGIGGLLGSGIALHPDLTSPLARLKLVLVLVLMLNGVAAQRMLHRLQEALPADVRGANIPWAVFQRVLFVGLVSQASWWGAIAIGFLTNANRTS
ncbi:MAG TPA: hypothetical protein VGR20_10200 [Acidimicrobiia bacterium]|nr:hypothetical protein [Acidimicrobiia bacterium]